MRHHSEYHQLVLHETPADFEAEYAAIRAAFIKKGTSLNRWLRENKIGRQLAYRALRGQSVGRRSLQVRRQVFHAAFGANP